jgi:DhnA family fructose-bisphosphate aldolase class Ia
MKRKMHRLLKTDGKILICAMDHTAFMNEPVPGLVAYGQTVRKAVKGGADAFLSPMGSANIYADDFGPAAVVVSVTTGDVQIGKVVEHALAIGADAIKSMVYPFSGDDSGDRATLLGIEAAKYGIPFIAEPIPFGFGAKDKHTPEIIAAGARLSAEAGADIVKTFYTGNPETMKKVIEYAAVPVVVLGGAVKGSTRDLFQEVYDAVIVAGAAGVAIGNNIWRSPDPEAICRGLAAIIHGGASVDEALKVAGVAEAVPAK